MARRASEPVIDVSITMRSGTRGVKVVTNATLSFTSRRAQRKLVKQMREVADTLEKYITQKTAERKAAPLGRRRPPPRRRPGAVVN